MQISASAFPARCAFVALAATLLAGCALAPYDDASPLKQAATLARVATPVSEPAAFVKEQRPAETPGYLPVGVTPPARALRPRDAAGARALEASLDADRKASQNFVNRPRPRPTYDGSKPPKVAPPPQSITPE